MGQSVKGIAAVHANSLGADKPLCLSTGREIDGAI